MAAKKGWRSRDGRDGRSRDRPFEWPRSRDGRDGRLEQKQQQKYEVPFVQVEDAARHHEGSSIEIEDWRQPLFLSSAIPSHPALKSSYPVLSCPALRHFVVFYRIYFACGPLRYGGGSLNSRHRHSAHPFLWDLAETPRAFVCVCVVCVCSALLARGASQDLRAEVQDADVNQRDSGIVVGHSEAAATAVMAAATATAVLLLPFVAGAVVAGGRRVRHDVVGVARAVITSNHSAIISNHSVQ
jgi:hypothetical protein